MSEIAIRRDSGVDIHPAQDQAVARLAQWAQAAQAAAAMAGNLVRTSFVPAAYRGKPEEATAAILAGAEVGLSPMAALRAFDNIQGTPAPKAITLRAIVQSLGHEIRIDESTNTVASVSARRKGSTDWQTSTWTIERAQQAGYPNKNPNWKTAPAAMLVARATAEVCRWVASDAIMGMAYTAEEIRDEGTVFEPRPAPSRVTAADILASTDQPGPRDEPPAALPAAEPTQPEQELARPGRDGMTRAQQGKLHALFKEVEIGDRGQRLQYVNEILAETSGRQVESSSDLTKAEAGAVIDRLQHWVDGMQPTDDELADVVGDVR